MVSQASDRRTVNDPWQPTTQRLLLDARETDEVNENFRFLESNREELLRSHSGSFALAYRTPDGERQIIIDQSVDALGRRADRDCLRFAVVEWLDNVNHIAFRYSQ